jgi:hypothetical protein
MTTLLDEILNGKIPKNKIHQKSVPLFEMKDGLIGVKQHGIRIIWVE